MKLLIHKSLSLITKTQIRGLDAFRRIQTNTQSRKNHFVDKTCFNCGEVCHIIVNCPNKKKDKKNDEKKKKKFIKKKNDQAYFVEWDSNASSDDDDDDDDKPSKGVAGIAIKRLHHSSLHHIVLWQRVVQRYNKMVNLMNFHMIILLKCSMMPMNS